MPKDKTLCKMCKTRLFMCQRIVSLLPFITLNNAGKRCRPDYLLWTGSALLFKGKEKGHAMQLAVAEDELMSKLTSAWDSEVYGGCPYMLAYAVAGKMLSIVALKWVHNSTTACTASLAWSNLECCRILLHTKVCFA